MKQLYFKTSQEWRDWLRQNHDREAAGIWLIFYKQNTGEPTLEYEAAVEEALCYGWIDSIIRKIDTVKYARKFTPRKEDSKWSEINKKRVAKLIEANYMTEIGLAKIEAAKLNGQWEKPDRPQISFTVPKELQEALDAHPKAKAFFKQLAPSYQKQFIGWIVVAKRRETKEKRIIESIALLGKGEKLGMR